MTLEVISAKMSDTIEVDASNPFDVSSPLLVALILASYLLTVFTIAPSFMKTRPAYQLKTFMIIYNVLQVLSCIYLVYKILVINLPSIQFWECVEFNRRGIVARDFKYISIFTFWLKVIELSETVVFVLRKKQRQVSFLHVFHHCSTLFLVYQLHMHYKASGALFPIFLNSNVHIVMYCYYLIAAIVPASAVARLTPIKKAITTIQMLQFALILLQVVFALFNGCYRTVPPAILTIYTIIICAFFYMFNDFYKKNYTARRQSAAAAKKERESNNGSANEL